MPTHKLFEPLQIGPCKLSHRIVMGPLGSYLADEKSVLPPSAADYYGERAQYPGTLIIGEATFVSAAASGTTEARAGIWTQAQVAAWKHVVDAVHARGSYIFLQLWALGRSADAEVKKRDGSGDVVSASAVPQTEGGHVPRALTEDEIWQYVEDYATAAKNAVVQAGFDGVELHGGNASLLDQFTQDCVNRRQDVWGGNVRNRSRFAVEVTKAVCNAIGAERVGYRLSPWSTYGGMGMSKEGTIEQFRDLLQELKALGIAYVHLVESRIAARVDVEEGEALTPFIESWGSDKPFVLAGGYNSDTARKAVDEDYKDQDVAIAFGRAFVSNPDLVQRIRDGKPLNH